MSVSELQQACEDAEITITSVHLMVDYSEDEKFPRDKWACTLQCNGKSATFEYFTGIGSRVLAPGVKREGNRNYVYRTSVVSCEQAAIEKNLLVLKRVKGKIVGPEVADVLSCLLSDSSACETTFDDWCSDFGCNSDSLSALNTYIACQRNGSKVRNFLSWKVAKDLQGKEH